MLHNLMLARAFYGPKTTHNNAADIYDAGDHYLLQLQAAGFDKEEISLEESGLSKREWNELMQAFNLVDKLI